MTNKKYLKILKNKDKRINKRKNNEFFEIL